MPPPATRPRLSRSRRGYGEAHLALRREFEGVVLAGGVRCARCGNEIVPGEPWDLGHVDGDPSRYAGPEHSACNRRTAGAQMPQRFMFGVPVEEPEPERAGMSADDSRWRVPWLKGFAAVPPDCSWPRLMSAPHERAVGSIGPEFIAWAEERSERELRWWQRLVATRILEVDEAGRLVWEQALLSMPRQLGKSWLLRELCFWRIHQAGLFGEPQDVLHTGMDLRICLEVQRRARYWAKQQPRTYQVREVNGDVKIELLRDGSRWMVQAKSAVNGYSVSLAAVDEAWKVKPDVIEEGVSPTMVEREQPQLLLVSTAHRLSTSLMVGRRAAALETLEDGDGILLVEWSAPADAVVDDEDVWRASSSQWSERRRRTVATQLAAARGGTLRVDDEPDPMEAFKAQWLNMWPRIPLSSKGAVEELLPDGLWESLHDPEIVSDGPIWVAVEDNRGNGAAVAAVARLDDGRLECDGWLFDAWDHAIDWVGALGAGRRIRHLQIGASVLQKAPVDLRPAPAPAGATETRVALPLLRDLAHGGELAHCSDSRDLADAVGLAMVRSTPTGLTIMEAGAPHLVKALAWALSAAHKRSRLPAIR